MDSMEYWNTTENCIDNLPTEALCHIFSYLEVKEIRRVRSVCKEWSELLHDELLWKQLCKFDWNVHALMEPTWRETYMRIENVLSEGHWEGMSKWVEPEGFDNEQKTSVKLLFHKRNIPKERLSSPSMIHRVDSTANSSVLRTPEVPAKNYKESMYKITGTGVTVNCTSHSYFRIEGERIDSDSTGATFQWNKQFEKHTSVYIGKVDYRSGTVNGTIDYHDGTTHWKGMFFYTKVKTVPNRKYSKMEAQVA